MWASVVSFCCVVSRVQTQFIGLGSKPLPPLSPLAKPRLDFLFFFYSLSPSQFCPFLSFTDLSMVFMDWNHT